jgi:molecular chaperone GrpE
MQREIQDREERARAEALKAVLPTVDNLHRAVEQSKQAKDMDSILSGIEIAEKNFLDTLGKLGVIRLESRGKAFDPSYHEAVAQQESEDVPAGTVMDEVQPGYLLGDKLLRAALVLVSRGKPKKKEEEKEKEGEEGSAAGPEDGEAESDNVD